MELVRWPIVILALLGPAVGLAQDGEPPQLMQHAYTLLHQPAREALPLILPLLSERGGIEVRAGSNTLVIRDTAERLHAILPVLRALDHEPQSVQIDVRLVQVGGSAAVSPPHSGLPDDVVEELRQHLPFQHFQLVAEWRLTAREQEQVAFSFGDRARVRFAVGTVLADKRLALYDFEVRGTDADAAPLLKARVNLWLGRTLALGMPVAPGSDGGMTLVVLTALSPAGGGGG